MPSGYTCVVEDGSVTELRDFVMRCARGMGACIMQRDDDMSDPPKLQEPSDYHSKQLARLCDELAALNKSDADCLAAAKAEHKVKLATNAKYREKGHLEQERYESMLAKVKAWEPPTAGHVGLKDFMVQQLTESMRFTLGNDFFKDQPEPTNGEEWRRDRLNRIMREIDYHTTQHAEEVERTNSRNEWIQQLYDCFASP